jgi:hypothetical protein
MAVGSCTQINSQSPIASIQQAGATPRSSSVPSAPVDRPIASNVSEIHISEVHALSLALGKVG